MIISKRTPLPVVKVDEFPYLAAVGKTVILVVAKSSLRPGELKGTVVSTCTAGPSTPLFPLGYYSESWNADELKRCPDTITLQNA